VVKTLLGWFERWLWHDDDGDTLDGCALDFADPRYLTSDEDREGLIEPSTATDEAEPSTRFDTAPVHVARGEIAR
jgi:hypothetical protein